MAQRRATRNWAKRRDSAQSSAPAAPSPGDIPSTELQRSARRLAKSAPDRIGARIEPTPEQLVRGTYATVRTKDPHSAAPIEVRRNLSTPLDSFLARGLVDRRQYDAATRYRGDYDRGGYERPVTTNYGVGGGSSTSANMAGLIHSNDVQLDARERVRAARAELPRRIRDYFDDVVLHDAPAVDVGERIGLTGTNRARFVLEYIRIGADDLAEFYRMPE